MPLHLHVLEPPRLAEGLGELCVVGHHPGVGALGQFAHFEGLASQPLRILEPPFHQGPGPPEQRHIPLGDRLPEDLGQSGIGLDLGIQPRDISRLEQRLNSEPVGQKLQLAVPGPPGQADHLLRGGHSLLMVLWRGDSVAVGAEGVGEGCRVGHSPGHCHGFQGQVRAALVRPHERQGHGQPRHHPGPEGRVLLR